MPSGLEHSGQNTDLQAVFLNTSSLKTKKIYICCFSAYFFSGLLCQIYQHSEDLCVKLYDNVCISFYELYQ